MVNHNMIAERNHTIQPQYVALRLWLRQPYFFFACILKRNMLLKLCRALFNFSIIVKNFTECKTGCYIFRVIMNKISHGNFRTCE